MSRAFLCSVVVLFALAPFTCATGKTNAIPLDQIWGHSIPGTRDVSELEPPVQIEATDEELASVPRKELVRSKMNEAIARSDNMKILSALGRPPHGSDAGSAFIVVGTGKESLANAANIFGKGAEPEHSFAHDDELTIVFYSYSCGRYVWLRSVERWSNIITVQYQFVSHPQTHMTSHFALIPLGQLPAGEYQVRVEQLAPMDERNRPTKPIENPDRFVSGSFSFTVREE